MTQKIKIVSLEKTPEYIDREWAQTLAQRQYLLSTSDWTQLEDNELTFESRVRWNHWRNRVRAIRRHIIPSKEEADALLKQLESQLPDREFISSNNARQKKYHLDLTDLDIAKQDAMLILKILHNEWATKLIPESIHLIDAKVEEMRQYYSMTKIPKTLKEFPLLSQMAKLNEWTISQVLEYVMNLKRTSTDVFISIENHRHKFIQNINSAKTVNEILLIVKNMHGY